MIFYCVSDISNKEGKCFSSENGLLDNLKKDLPEKIDCLFIASDPSDHKATDYYSAELAFQARNSGISFSSYRILDSRNEKEAESLVLSSNLLILSGGHVPTQNRFFKRIGLKEILKYYKHLIIGISAGSMNSSHLVYAQPEEEGEASDPSYRRFLPGLGLMKAMIIPHYYSIKDDILDGLRVLEDITLPDSFGHTFYAIPDGSYIRVENEQEVLYGEAYLIKDGMIKSLSSRGEVCKIMDSAVM